MIVARTALSALVLAAALGAVSPSAQDDGKREFTLTGCLLRAGYAGYQMENVAIDAVEGKAVPAGFKTPVTAQKWTLQGGGNLGPRVGEKVQVIGRSDWQEKLAAASEEPPKSPALEVKTVKTVAPNC
jgi:hypothetical protein